MDRVRLDAALIDAHESGDKAELVQLYREAGDHALAEGDIGAGCFFYTHAYVFALESGDPARQELLSILVSHGRDEARS